MSFDPELPRAHTKMRSAEIRSNFVALNDQDTATNIRIDNIQLTPGPQGPKGDQGEPGPGFTSPYPGDLAAQGSITAQGALLAEGGHLAMGSGLGSSSEDGLRVMNNGRRPLFVGRSGGSNLFSHTMDLPGLDDGGGVPSVQDGDNLRYSAGTETWKPSRGLASRFAGMTALSLTISDPPTQAEVQAVANRLDEILAALQQA